MEARLNCRYYLGEKPCKYKRLCQGCMHYLPMGRRILILKLGAMGDALRTTPILHALEREYPLRHITWITDQQSYSILKNNSAIDRLLTIDSPDILRIFGQEFDLLLSLDKAPQIIALSSIVRAFERKGFVMSPWGTLDVYNESARYALALGLDDELKFRINRKTYQETIYEIADLPYQRDHYIYELPQESRTTAKTLLMQLNAPGTGPRIGLNTGCGDIFATKKWPDYHFIQLAHDLRNKMDARVYLLGGNREINSNRHIVSILENQVVDTGVNSLDVFAGVISHLDMIITGDTMALHLALALQTKVIGLFGPTCAHEIDFYGLGNALVATDECCPCYRSKCQKPESCMATITPDIVYSSIQELFPYHLDTGV